MVDSKTCPICGRKGINDFHKEDVKCPNCGSDLRAFRIINAIEMESKAKSTVWKPVALVAMIAALLFAILYFTKGASPTAQKEKISMLEDSIAALNEKVNDNKNLLAKQQEQQPVASSEKPKVVEEKKANEEQTTQNSEEKAKPEEKQKEEITAAPGSVTMKNGKKIYVVKKGDTWWGISKKLYNLKVTDKEIAKMNGKSENSKLEIGQELVVK